MKSLYDKDIYLMDSNEEWEGISLRSIMTEHQAKRKHYLIII